MKKYFKVVPFINNEVVIDTTETNYSSTLSKAKELEGLLLCMSYFSSNFGIPINVLYLVNNGLATIGNPYLQQLPRSNKGVFTADQFTKDPYDNQFVINECDLINFIETTDKTGFKDPFEGFYIWEYLFEQVREQLSTSLPKRTESFFLFESVADCERYMSEIKRIGMICEVELMETKQLFRADMTFINDIPNNINANNVYSIAEKYWKGESSENPLYEIIFQGKCKLKPIK